MEGRNALSITLRLGEHVDAWLACCLATHLYSAGVVHAFAQEALPVEKEEGAGIAVMPYKSEYVERISASASVCRPHLPGLVSWTSCITNIAAAIHSCSWLPR
jgi:hypothetical protein